MSEKHYLVPWTYGWMRLGQNNFMAVINLIADIYTYGTIRALHGMDTHTEILEKNEKLRNWYNRMFETVVVAAHRMEISIFGWTVYWPK